MNEKRVYSASGGAQRGSENTTDAELSAYQFVVSDDEAGQRLDRYLVSRKLPRSRSQLKRQIDGGYCLVAGVAAKPARKLRSGETVFFFPPAPDPATVEAEAIELSILYEDDQLVVVDKPAGMVVHPAPGHRRGTLVGALLGHCDSLSGVGGVLRPGIVHRLDKLTSGVMVASKTDRAHEGLAEQFRRHSIERRYLALVEGQLVRGSGRFETLHGRHPTDRKRFTSRVDRGKSAVTSYQVVRRLRGASLVEATLDTGRTHQVRVHFADGGHPLLGDPQYGRVPGEPLLRRVARELGRQALHARVLAFGHPGTGQRLRFVAPVPPDMQRAIAALQLEEEEQ
jgi:23S rRNA pseudouridine1911/1915/1917 synthase